MGSFEKYMDNAVIYELKHNTREHARPPKNIDIDPERTKDNYALHLAERGSSARQNKDYYNRRIQEVYRFNRADVKTACQWIVTAPKDLPLEQEKDFFRETYNYLNSLYGEQNCIQAIVHYDEGVKNEEGEIIAGRSHLHYMFIPVVENKKYLKPNKKGNITTAAKYREKVCADQLINKKHLEKFHPDYQKWLNDHGIRCTVHSGITGGKNRTVEELKYETREIEKSRARIRELEKENAELKEKVISLEQQLSKQREHSGWSSAPGWGKEKSRSWEKDL